MSRLRLVLAGALARYPQGGGHWACFLQYLLGLRDLGHDVLWLDVLVSTGTQAGDERLAQLLLKRFEQYRLRDVCALLVVDQKDEQDLRTARAYGASKRRLAEFFRTADLLWNFAAGVRLPLLSLFRHRVLVDGDPGHLQVSAQTWDLGLQHHQIFLTTGTKLSDADHQWTWKELWHGDRVLSVGKRAAYLSYLDLPRVVGRPFELAVNLHPRDHTGDPELLRGAGWRLVHPHRVASTVSGYQRYLRRSRAEFGCPKPIHRELRTGWFSDRSACYLASGRPVLIEDTGLSDHLPTGEGLLVFRDLAEAVAGVEEIDRNYARHHRAARELAEDDWTLADVSPRCWPPAAIRALSSSLLE